MFIINRYSDRWT